MRPPVFHTFLYVTFLRHVVDSRLSHIAQLTHLGCRDIRLRARARGGGVAIRCSGTWQYAVRLSQVSPV